MFEVELDPASVARVRVAASPLFELVAWLAVVADRHVIRALGDPGAAARFALRDRDVSAVAASISAAATYLVNTGLPDPETASGRAQCTAG